MKDQYISPLQLDLNVGGEGTLDISASEGTLSQYFSAERDLQYIDVLMKNKGADAEQVTGTLYNASTGEELSSCETEVEVSDDEEIVHFELATDGITSDTLLLFEITSDSQSSNGVEYCVQTGDYEENMLYGLQETDYRLRMSVTYGAVFNKLFLLATVFVALVAVAIFFVPARWNKLQNLFVMIALSSGIAFAVINPAVQECDGWDHFLRAMDVSYGNVLGSFVNLTHDDGEIIVPANYSEFKYDTVAANANAGTLYTYHLKNTKFSDDTITLEYTGGVTSVFYWPQGLGIWIGRTLNLSMYMCVVLSRIFNLFAFIVVTYYAIKIMPMFRNIFTVIALLPMTIYQAASDSPDALLNAFCFLFIALCFKYAYDEKAEFKWKQALGLGVLLTCIFMCKYVYVCIGVLVFMIPMKKVGEKKEYWMTFVIALIPLIVIGGFLAMHMMTSVGTIQADNGDTTQIQNIMHSPQTLVKAVINTINYYFRYYVDWLNTLGTMNYPLSFLIPVMPAFIVGVGCLDVSEASQKMRSKDKVLCLTGFTLSVLGLLVALYIGDGRINPVGADMILGGQGRYFIAVMVLVFAAFSSRKVENKIEHFSTKVIGAMGIMMLYAVITLVMICY